MERVLAIADDLTGAAEIAGIGLRYGLPTRLVRDQPTRCDEGLTVIDTDTRLLAHIEAARVVCEFVSALNPRDFDLIYKKTDSAFRGPLLAEVDALMRALRKPAALILPQNPSRGRTIRNGEYRIDGVPLHQTGFADDPDHPARSSDVLKLLTSSEHLSIVCAENAVDLPRDDITIAAASDVTEVRQWADRVKPHVLPVGGADFFAANLESRQLTASRSFLDHLNAPSRLFVCGSASAYSRNLESIAQQNGVAICAMPDDVFHGGDVSRWVASIRSALRTHSRALVTIAQPLDRVAGASQRLQSALAEVVARLLSQNPIDALLLEGGATASAVCWRMGWNQLEVTGELDTGVVQMRVTRPHPQTLLLKPGSYPWPDVVWK